MLKSVARMNLSGDVELGVAVTTVVIVLIVLVHDICERPVPNFTVEGKIKERALN